MKNNKIRSFLKKPRFVLTVTILFFSFFFTQSASAANKTWDNSSGDGLWNTPTNWSTDTVPGSGDKAIFAVSNTTNCTVNTTLNIGGFQIDAGYSGTVDLSTYTMSTGSLTLNGGTLEATNSSSITATSYGQSGTSIFNVPVDLTVNGGNFTYSAGTFTHNNGTVTYNSISNASITFSASGMTLYNLVFDKTDGSTGVSYLAGNFSVNDLTVKNNSATGGLSFNRSGANPVITVNGNLNFPATAGTLTAHLSSYSIGDFSINLYGDLTMDDAQAGLGAHINFLGAGTQTITQATGTISGGAWTVNKTNTTDTVILLTSLSGSPSLTLTQGIFDATISSGMSVTTYNQSSTSTFRAPINFSVSSNFTYNAGTFTHNNGTVTIYNPGYNTTLSCNGITFYNLKFDKNGSDSSSNSTFVTGTFTVNDLIVQNNGGTWNTYITESGTAVINVSGNFNFPLTAGTVSVYFGSSGDIVVNLYGNIVMSDENVFLRANVNFVGASTQTVTQTLGAISGGTWTVNKTNFTDTVTQATPVLTPTSLVVTKGTYDTGGYNLTASGITVSAGSTFRLKGDEAVTATPTLSASSIVEYYATSSSRALKSWTYTNSTLKINGAGGTFVLPANSTISTTTILAGTLSLAGFNLTSSLLQNNSFLQLKGGETITVSSSTRTGTMEYIGDGDSALDNYTINNISNLSFNNLSIAPTDSADTYTLPATLNLSGNFTKTNGVISAGSTNLVLSGSGQAVTVNSTSTFLTLAKTLTSASDTLTFGTTGSLAITGATTLQGTASYPLALRSSTPDTQWLFDPQGARNFSYLNVQDSWNLNATAINSPSITGFVNSGNNTNWGIIFLPTITSSASSVTDTAATLNGNITNTGGEDNTIRGFEYGLTTAYGTATSTSGSYSTGAYTATLTGLSSETTYHYRAFSTNSAGTATSTDQSFTTLDNTAPTLSAITAIPAPTSAVITWTTNEPATSRVQYGPSTSYGDLTAISNLSGTTTHSVTLPNLVSCTNYHYRVISADLSDNTATSSDYSFSIGGCTGNSTVTASSTEETLTADGVTVILSDLTLEVPADFTATTSSVVFQAKELEQTEFFAVVTAPADFTFVGNFIFNLKTLIDSTTTLPSFDVPLTITMSYDPATLGNISESSLVIYRYDAPTWTPLSSCSVNTTLHTVTCTTTNFSDFGLFGQVAVATPATTRVSGTHFGCKDPKATNYEFFSSHRQSLCQYALIPTTPPITIQISTSTATTTKYLFTRNLKLYMTGADVKALQQYLNASGFPVSTTGPGSKGAETTMFGAKTQAALIKFQKANGITPAVGYFGPVTRGRLY